MVSADGSNTSDNAVKTLSSSKSVESKEAIVELSKEVSKGKEEILTGRKSMEGVSSMMKSTDKIINPFEFSLRAFGKSNVSDAAIINYSKIMSAIRLLVFGNRSMDWFDVSKYMSRVRELFGLIGSIGVWKRFLVGKWITEKFNFIDKLRMLVRMDFKYFEKNQYVNNILLKDVYSKMVGVNSIGYKLVNLKVMRI